MAVAADEEEKELVEASGNQIDKDADADLEIMNVR